MRVLSSVGEWWIRMTVPVHKSALGQAFGKMFDWATCCVHETSRTGRKFDQEEV